jgi:hypothetical protein
MIHAKGLLTGLLMDASFDADSNASWEYAGARIPFKAGVYARTHKNQHFRDGLNFSSWFLFSFFG